ncbi:MAG TPA: VOC family protein [Terriglobales bacterium]|nr:VOC family protein [Terriglobales bacterium]
MVRVDHLVWYCADPVEGENHFAARMDCRPVYGGVHPGEGTCNSLLSLADSTYVEILGRDPAQAISSLDPELQTLTGAGLYHWAAGGVDLAALRAKVLAAGLEGSDLVTGGRTLPNGNWLGWKLFGLKNHGFGALVPFFIDWMESVHPAKSAPRGGSFVKLEARSPEPEKLRDLYRLLGLDIAVIAAAAPGLSATIESRSGPHVLRMVEPIPRGFVI